MTKAQFLTLFRKKATQYHWHFLGTGGVLRSVEQMHAVQMCPLTVTFNKHWAASAVKKKAGMRTWDAVIAAADFQSGHDKKLRAKILSICGLKEHAPS